jgi:hypothetical protein
MAAVLQVFGIVPIKRAGKFLIPLKNPALRRKTHRSSS